nr:translation initiation factor eiF2 beta-subunit [Cryptomonas curvata]|mmetsp:Transcript_8184/g.17549  ORF Transcript_8184/g.17549 Transcript_8184/m.17549 type:complete len:193 (-) Transcript_8184:153-731(-)
MTLICALENNVKCDNSDCIFNDEKNPNIYNVILDKELNKYRNLLDRLFKMLNKNNIGLVIKDKIVIQTPKIAREGTKKTIFLNFEETCIKLHRESDHVVAYISTELGTTVSIQEGGRLVLRGRFNQKGIENILRNYINEYVLCGSCKSVNTYFKKSELNKLFFLKCEVCRASRFINPIKAGFVAQTKRKKKI